jgi:hypothetical protein
MATMIGRRRHPVVLVTWIEPAHSLSGPCRVWIEREIVGIHEAHSDLLGGREPAMALQPRLSRVG